MLTRVVVKKPKFCQGCRCSLMYLPKMNALRSISQTFEHSVYKFRVVCFSKQLAADFSGFCNLFSM